MSRPFKKNDAAGLISGHREILKKLNDVISSESSSNVEIQSAADDLINAGVIQILDGIPVDELNRDKKGIRVKNLRDSGYNTMADIYTADTASLAAVNGISDEGASSVRRIAAGIAAKAREGVKIKLSTDSKTAEATRLVTLVSKQIRRQPVAGNCRSLTQENLKTVADAVKAVESVNGAFKWLLATSDQRQRAVESYNLLQSMLEGEYAESAKQYLEQSEVIERSSDETAWKHFAANPVQFYNVIENINPDILGNDDLVYGLPEDLALEISQQPLFLDGLLCELRRYQEWGVKYILHQKKVLLGDEMGLGKTVQAIAAMVSLSNVGETHFVVVCPASVMTNWCREIKKMSGLEVTAVHGTDRREEMQSWLETGGVAVTTYEASDCFELPEGCRFSLLTVDEAHYIKNPDANRTKNVKSLSRHADRLLFMTGTALENKVDEMVSLINVLQPDISRRVRGMEALSSAPAFRETVAPVYYRRKREEVATELPELIETREWCSMNRIEENAYENAVLSKNYPAVRRVSWNVDDIEYSSKAQRLSEIVEEAESDGRKVIVFSFFLDTIGKVTQLLGDRCTEPINGSVPPERRQEIIDGFDKAPAGKVLVAQIQSGGTGLNIQSASVVILCEPQFKPSIENQAISRAYRMGQTRNVLVYRLLCDGTVEEKIMSVLESKQAIFDAFADKSSVAQVSNELDNSTFGSLVEEEIKRINEKNSSTASQSSENL